MQLRESLLTYYSASDMATLRIISSSVLLLALTLSTQAHYQGYEGTCPVLPPDAIGICVEECSGDHTCPSGELCCSNGCGHTCQKAVGIPGGYTPPVNEPNDCPIRCITTPCPCGATCPTLHCPTDCKKSKLDKRGCNTCKCQGDGTDMKQCPKRKCRHCPNGYKIDEHGCRTCTCEDIPCPLPLCLKPCPNGYRLNKQGCQTCECEEEPTYCDGRGGCNNACPYGYVRDPNTDCITCKCKKRPGLCTTPKCLVACEFGSVPDENGCETCDCITCPKITPCAVVRCASGSIPTIITPSTGCPTCECVPEVEIDKAGACPANDPDMAGICIADCTFDSECPGNQKCCGSCPRQCVVPVTKPVVKPGRCPRQRFDAIGTCDVRCEGDQSCPGDQKCCGNCPRQCVDPAKKRIKKPGRCPRRQLDFDTIGTCDVRCQADESCPGDQKCCGSCPRKCEDPQSAPEPGRCPRRFLRKRACRRVRKDRCQSDEDCTNGRICCGNCGKRCVRPTRRKTFF